MGKINSGGKLCVVGLIPYTAGILISKAYAYQLIGMTLCILFGCFSDHLVNWIKKD